MVDNPTWEICERVAEVIALLHDHIECGKHSAGTWLRGHKLCCRGPNCYGDVRRWLLPAEHAAGRMSAVRSVHAQLLAAPSGRRTDAIKCRNKTQDRGILGITTPVEDNPIYPKWRAAVARVMAAKEAMIKATNRTPARTADRLRDSRASDVGCGAKSQPSPRLGRK
jgi:hypothetical protein